MPTIQEQPGDIQWIVDKVSATTQPDYPTAFAAAVALSAANGNAPVSIARINQKIMAAVFPSTLDHVDCVRGIFFFVRLTSSTTYYPLETARAQAYALSNANSSAGVFVGYVMQTVTAP